MSDYRLCLFGAPALLRDGEAVEMGPRKVQALLAYLAVTGQPHTRDALATLFWPEHGQTDARAALRRMLYRANQVLADVPISTSGETIWIEPDALWVDVTHYQAEVAAALPPDGAVDLARLAEAVKLYTGEFMAGFSLPDCPEFGDWQFLQQTSARQTQVQATALLAEAYRARADWATALDYARQQVALEPLHEPAHRQLMTLYALAGRHAAALRQYQECVRLLEEELGAEPEPATVELAEAIRTKRIGAAPPVPPAEEVAPAPVADAAEPEMASSGQPAPAHNLPSPSTPFVGREQELNQLLTFLDDPTCRLLTLVGPSGAGKTRLALELAWRLVEAEETQRRFPDGIRYVPLAEVAGLDGMVAAIAEAAGFRFHDVGGLQRQLLDRMRDQRMLLVLDSLEQLQGATDLVSDLLAVAPGLGLLVTSQAALNLQEEWFHALTGLACPPSEQIALHEAEQYDAVRFFVQCAQRARVGYALAEGGPAIVRICHLVGGMPLALELAAAWVKVLPAQTIADEIARGLDILTARHRNVPERHRSMRVVLEQTWSLLEEDARLALHRLAVFRGSFTPDAALVVAGATHEMLARLAERSILQFSSAGRYILHDLLRQFAAEKLAQENGRATQLHRDHSLYYVDLLLSQGLLLSGRRQQQALTAIATDLENIRAAWLWAAHQPDLLVLQQAGDVLFTFHQMRGRFQEGQELFAQAAAQLALRSAESDPAYRVVRARLAARQAAFAYHLGQYTRAQRQLASSLPIVEEFGDARELVFVLSLLAEIEGWQGKVEQAKAQQERCLNLSRELGDRRLEAEKLSKLAELAGHVGDYAEGLRLGEAALEIARLLGEPYLQAYILALVAWYNGCLGQFAAAEANYQRSLAIRRELGDQAGIANCLNSLGWVAWCEGGARLAEARGYLQESLNLDRQLGRRLGMSMAYWKASLVAVEQEDYAQARHYGQQGVDIARELESNLYMTPNLLGLGMALGGLGDFAAARSHLLDGLALAQRSALLPSMAILLYGLAWVSLRAGEQGETVEDGELVARWLKAVVDHPATWHAIKERAARLLGRLKSQFPDQVRRAALDEGAALPITAVVEALVRESTA